MDQNTVKRKIATALAVCLLAASAAPAVLAEDTGIALMEATPSEPTRAALKLTRITPGQRYVGGRTDGTAGQNVTVDLTTMDEEDVGLADGYAVRVGQRGRSVYGLESRAVCRDRAVRQIAYGKGIRVAGKYRRHRSGADAQAVRSDYAQADGEQRAGGENYPEASDSPTPQPTANAFTVGLYAAKARWRSMYTAAQRWN